jgi:ABC-type oligopeptide transport system ATPase subunit|tara:strand:+ start:1773 stop:2015 length:243 start_codon:yes stop_codon:yes gene_type:complete
MSKIEEKELEVLQEQEKKKGAILHDLGLLETQKHSLNHMYAELMVEQDKSKKELEEKYGKININLSDGSFEEIKEDEKNK